MNVPTKIEMYDHYFEDPKGNKFQKEINHVKVQYFYFQSPFTIQTGRNEVCNFCIVKGSSQLTHTQEHFTLNQFDMVFLPPNEHITINPGSKDEFQNKICIVTAPILENHTKEHPIKFEIQRFALEKFLPRGELGDTRKMATYREIWTAFKNGYFMSGFTNIPQTALAQGVITSVNLEKEGETIKIYSHIHPGYPEIYIYCIDDPTASIPVTQFLINIEGQSVSKNLTDGAGIFFDGSLGHMNFVKPTYRNLKYCLYMWIIPTYGKVQDITPQSLKC
ncbi:MAG: hypothetical protein LUQ65_06430 [Candidatus Helarchaeota archaeon]|nr:hypothetical protein [Candidatus Helarchaeota archaeon]